MKNNHLPAFLPVLALALVLPLPAGAQKPPPTLVAVAPVARGTTEPMTEFVGTVYYPRVSNVASEVEGRVDEVFFEEGERVEEGRELVRLNTELLDLAVEGTRGSYDQVQVDIEEADKSLKRIEPLYREGTVSEVVFDEAFFKKRRLEVRSAVLKAELDGQLLEKRKKTILSPFTGIVMKKVAEKGEWVSEGGTVAVIADDGEVDVIVDLPSALLGYLDPDRKVKIRSGGKTLTGRFVSFVPKGDIATRTFAVKFRLDNSHGLIEGMEARALIATDRRTTGLIVPRDAVIDKYGRMVVFLMEEGKAKMVPVTVTGQDGLTTGVSGPGLEAGQTVVVKGNERLRDGQPVRTAQ